MCVRWWTAYVGRFRQLERGPYYFGAVKIRGSHWPVITFFDMFDQAGSALKPIALPAMKKEKKRKMRFCFAPNRQKYEVQKAIYFFEMSVLFETGELNAYVYDGGGLYRRKYV